AEHSHVVDRRVLLERRLNLRRVDIHSTGDDHVALAVADVEVSLVVPVGDVADSVEVAAAGCVVAIALLVVLVEHASGPDEEFTRIIRPGAGDLVALLVEQDDLDAGGRLATRTRLAHLVLGLEHAVDT